MFHRQGGKRRRAVAQQAAGAALMRPRKFMRGQRGGRLAAGAGFLRVGKSCVGDNVG